ncbi:MAG: hypothetical protein WCF84_19310 [Anaerolineae bacterium]
MKRVLFIDLRNTSRSQMAEAWFNQFALGWGEARSCGTMPAQSSDPFTVTVMAEAGIDIRQAKPQAVNQRLLSHSELVVIMGPDVYPHAFNPTHIWDFLDPTGESIVHYRIQRDAIRQRVQELVMEMHTGSEYGKFDPTTAALLQSQLMIEYQLFR